MLEQLARALHDWVALGRPLMLVAGGASFRPWPELEPAPRQIRLLSADPPAEARWLAQLQLASIGTTPSSDAETPCVNSIKTWN